MDLKRNGKGFTLIELLVVVAIMGLLLSIISLGYKNQRQRARDAKRLSDLKQIKSGMDIYFHDGSGYPPTAAWTPGATLRCQTNSILMIPHDPGYPAVQDYDYEALGGPITGCGTGGLGRAYTFTFYMESTSAVYTMDEDGVVRDTNGNVISVDTLLHTPL